MTLRILLAVHAPADDRTAVYRSTLARADLLRRQGHHVEVLTRESLLPARWARLDPLLLPLLLALRTLGRYDVVVFHSYLGWAFHAMRRWLDPGGRVTTATSFHGLEPLYHRSVVEEYRRMGQRLSARYRLLHHVILPRLLRATCRASDLVFCLNSREVEYLTLHGWARPERIHRTANGVEPECFVAGRSHHADVRRLIFVGQWLPPKGIRYLAKAFSKLAARRDLELFCVGTGSSPELVRETFPMVSRSHVTVIPSVNRKELYDQLTHADVFVFPSLSEGFSRALLEALAAGVPVVASDVGAAADLLTDGDNAIVVAPGDAAALSAGIERLLDDARLRAELAAAGQRTASRYTADAALAGFADALFEGVRRRSLERSTQMVAESDVHS